MMCRTQPVLFCKGEACIVGLGLGSGLGLRLRLGAGLGLGLGLGLEVPRSATLIRPAPPQASTAAATCRGRTRGRKARAERMGAVGAARAEQAHRLLAQQLRVLHV